MKPVRASVVIPGIFPSLCYEMRAMGGYYKIRGENTILFPPHLQGESNLLVIPDRLPKSAIYRIELSEGTNLDFSRVVCTTEGSMCNPYVIHRDLRSNSDHAMFAIDNEAIAIWGKNGTDLVSIQHHIIDYRDGSIRIISQYLWRGDLSNLPDGLTCFRKAATAAQGKANCPNCQCLHYTKNRWACGTLELPDQPTTALLQTA